MKKFIIYILLFSFAFFCPVQASKMPKVKPGMLYDMQNRTFDTSNAEQVWNAVVTTLYDSDFLIEDIDKDLGHIRAVKTFKSHYVSKKRIAGWSTVLLAAGAYTAFSYGATAYTMYEPTRRIANEMRDKTILVDINVNISKTKDNKISVKFIPVEKILQNADGFSFNQSAPIRIIRIYKPKIYDEFFNQVEKNINLFI